MRMFKGLRRYGLALVLAAGGGACSMPMSQLLRDLTPGNGTPPAVPVTILSCPSAVAVLAPKPALVTAAMTGNVTKIDPFDITALRQNIQMFQQNVLHPDLQKEPVVREFLRALGTTILQTQTNSIRLVYASGVSSYRATSKLESALATLNAEAANTDTFGQPRDLNYNDFMSFATSLRRVALEASVSGPTQSSSASQPNFDEAFINYFQAYFKGKYVDRFGDTLPGPNSLQNISDNEIAGTLQVFLELIMDYVFQTPIWYDKDNKYYPGTGSDTKNTPTVVTVNKMPKGGMPLNKIPLLPDSASESCGITALKAQAVQYIAQTVGDRASQLGGDIGGSFGGINIGLGVLGKFSIGDNKTVHSLITTTLQKTFTRAGEEASYRILEVIAYPPGTTLAELIQKYLAAQLATLSSS